MSPLLAPEAVFIATLGTEPQVITTALDLLLRRGEKIRQVVVLHTVSPGTAIEAACRTLEQEFARPPYAPEIPLRLVLFQVGDEAPAAEVKVPKKFAQPSRPFIRKGEVLTGYCKMAKKATPRHK